MVALILATLDGCAERGRRDSAVCAPVSVAAWRHAAVRGRAGRETPKQALAARLVHCHFLRGRTRRAVRALLGRPSSVMPRDGTEPEDWVYFTGVRPDSPDKGTALSLEFDRGGRVSRAFSE